MIKITPTERVENGTRRKKIDRKEDVA